LVLTFAHLPNNLALSSDGFDSCEEATCLMCAPLDTDKFPGSLAVFQAGANLGVSNLAHAATERIPYQESLVHNGLALEVLVPSERDSLVGALRGIGRRLQLLGMLPRRPNDGVRLVSEVCREPTMSS
jgi:hypothetical protein